MTMRASASAIDDHALAALAGVAAGVEGLSQETGDRAVPALLILGLRRRFGGSGAARLALRRFPTGTRLRCRFRATRLGLGLALPRLRRLLRIRLRRLAPAAALAARAVLFFRRGIRHDHRCGGALYRTDFGARQLLDSLDRLGVGGGR